MNGPMGNGWRLSKAHWRLRDDASPRRFTSGDPLAASTDATSAAVIVHILSRYETGDLLAASTDAASRIRSFRLYDTGFVVSATVESCLRHRQLSICADQAKQHAHLFCSVPSLLNDSAKKWPNLFAQMLPVEGQDTTPSILGSFFVVDLWARIIEERMFQAGIDMHLRCLAQCFQLVFKLTRG